MPLALESKVGDIVKKEAGELLTAEVDFRSLDLSLLRHFPHASVELEGLTVVCAAPFEGDTLASVGRISVVVDLMSLFGDSGYEVTKLLVDKAHLHARKLADGSVNWDVMKPSDEPAEEKEPAEADEPSAFRLRMRDVRLSEAVVRYEDDSTGMRAGVDPLDLRLSGDLSGERSDLDLRLEAHRLSYAAGGVALLRDADLTADVTLDADLKNKRFTFSDNRLSLNAIALSLDGWVALADDLLEQLGIDCSEPRNPGRQLVLWDKKQNVRFILVKPSDVPTYVDHGVADLGVVGKDTLLEAGRELYEVLDLGFGKCRLCIAGYPGEQGGSVNRATFRVATKYPNIARSYYDSKGQTIEIIELHGSVELGPVIGLSDVILDIVESGSTLRANGLTVLEDICDVSARLVVNRVAMKTKRERIRQIIDGLGALLAVKQEGQA